MAEKLKPLETLFFHFLSLQICLDQSSRRRLGINERVIGGHKLCIQLRGTAINVYHQRCEVIHLLKDPVPRTSLLWDGTGHEA